MRRIHRHLTYANVISTLALFLVLSGGVVYAANTVGSADVINESLTGKDIKNKSGVDTCVNTIRLGNLCVRAENQDRPWFEASQHCANLDLRQPTLSEGMQLGKTHDIPNVSQSEAFWTGDRYDGGSYADTGNEYGNGGAAPVGNPHETVCVTTPTN